MGGLVTGRPRRDYDKTIYKSIGSHIFIAKNNSVQRWQHNFHKASPPLTAA
jgi:hypothetical protein